MCPPLQTTNDWGGVHSLSQFGCSLRQMVVSTGGVGATASNRKRVGRRAPRLCGVSAASTRAKALLVSL